MVGSAFNNSTWSQLVFNDECFSLGTLLLTDVLWLNLNLSVAGFSFLLVGNSFGNFETVCNVSGFTVACFETVLDFLFTGISCTDASIHFQMLTCGIHTIHVRDKKLCLQNQFDVPPDPSLELRHHAHALWRKGGSQWTQWNNGLLEICFVDKVMCLPLLALRLPWNVVFTTRLVWRRPHASKRNSAWAGIPPPAMQKGAKTDWVSDVTLSCTSADVSFHFNLQSWPHVSLLAVLSLRRVVCWRLGMVSRKFPLYWSPLTFPKLCVA